MSTRSGLLATAVMFGSIGQMGVATAQPVELDELVVTASGFAQTQAAAPASITVISGEEIRSKQAFTLTDILSDVEGVDVSGKAGKTGGFDIRMRGMPAEYTLILIDGRRQNTAGNVTPNGFGQSATSFLPPPAAIERIEVVRGPMSTLYGSDAMGGVINIITRKVSPQWTSSLTAETTFNEDRDYGDSRAYSAYTTGPLVDNLIGLQLRGRWFERDESALEYLDLNGDPMTISTRGPSPVESEQYTVGGRLTVTPGESNDFWLDIESSRQDYDNSEGQLGTLGVKGYGPELAFDRDQIAVGHTGRLAIGTLETSVMRNITETSGRLIPKGVPGKTAGSDRELLAENRVIDSKLVMPVDNHMVTVGGQWFEASMTDGVASEEFKQKTQALFVEDEWFVAEDLALTLGGRYDHHDAFGGQFSPRAYLVWNSTPELTIKGGVSRGYKTPGLEQLAPGIVGFTGQGTIPMFGNPALQPEKSTSTELALIYDKPGVFRVGATVFYNDFTDKIANGPDLLNCRFADAPNRPGCVDKGDWPKANTFAQKLNIDDAITRGVELHGMVPVARHWRLGMNYTYTDSEQQSGENKGQPLTDTPAHMANVSLNWTPSVRWSAFLKAEYESERYRARDRVRGAPSYHDLGDFKAFTLVHLGGRLQATQNLAFSAAIYNLLDKDFIDYQAYENGTLYGNRYANPEEGRRLWLSANLTF
ncbi:TonB-dependent receptor domain-containing protein [Marinobacter sp. X15-166B]|uniref:TonB-dependent receptor domain-containing protein n=1 Tax=Marinobacter sp. X15-166B TaxID=1897620 RepID=UPI00085CBF25|nr:TonB-dependent receptor [Marinobacter sp. X15-166B]OEY66087.1 TonB-dependent receptor [Marinobacter sp. X15-166B]